jgi:hypothetical protein
MSTYLERSPKIETTMSSGRGLSAAAAIGLPRRKKKSNSDAYKVAAFADISSSLV